MKKLVKSARQMLAEGEMLGARLKGGDVVTLTGEMGAGKTVFTKGVAKALGVKEEILSPTFTIMNVYSGTKYQLYHYDAYRLSDEGEAAEAGLGEYLASAEGVSVVEWPQNIQGCFENRHVIRVTIEYAGENLREITIDDE